MPRNFFLLPILLFLCGALGAQTYSAEETAVRQTLQNYIDGRNNGDLPTLTSAFHPTAELRYMKRDSAYTIWPIADYLKGVRPGRKADCIARIVSVDVLGAAAQAKIELEYARGKYADYLNLLKVDGEWLIAVKTFAFERFDPKKRILFVLTSSEKSGAHLGEISHAYQPLHEAGFEIDFVSPEGGKSQVYGANLNDPRNLWFVQQPAAWFRFTHAYTPDAIDAARYAAIYYVGGHGTMWDFPENAALAGIAKDIYEADGIVSGVCHGPAGLVNVKLSDGSYLVDGKQMTAFTDAEETESGGADAVPFLLESKLRERGARFQGAKNWKENVVVDGRLITGQNPASAHKLATEIIRSVEKKNVRR